MFAWANKHLEKLAETVAPASDSNPSYRFVACVSKGDYDTALSLLHSGEVEPGGILPMGRPGMTPLHLACRHGAKSLVDELLERNAGGVGVGVNVVDSSGDTPLHYGADHFDLVKSLVEERGASVTARNASGQTPYDVSTDSRVRQYLLPRQLQQETRESFERGDAPMPGIDLGSYRTQVAAMGHGPPPPPSMTMPAPPPMEGSGVMTTPMPPPPSSSSSSPYHPPPPSCTVPTSPPIPSTPGSPGMVEVDMNSPATDFTNQGLMGYATSHTQNGTGLPPPPISTHTTTLNGVGSSSSKAQLTTPTTQTQTMSAIDALQQPPPSTRILPSRMAVGSRSTTSAGLWKPDGFHSSSSDKNLQHKYGHTAIKTETPPPPPTNFLPPPPLSTTVHANVHEQQNAYSAHPGIPSSHQYPHRRIHQMNGSGASTSRTLGPPRNMTIFNPGAARTSS